MLNKAKSREMILGAYVDWGPWCCKAGSIGISVNAMLLLASRRKSFFVLCGTYGDHPIACFETVVSELLFEL